MTTILAVQYEDEVVIAADCRTIDSSGRTWKTTSKITRNGAFLIGGAGDCLPLDIANYIWKAPKPTLKDFDNLNHFMVVSVVPSLRKAIEDGGYVKKENDPEAGFAFILVINGEIFTIDDEYSVDIPNFNVAAVGTGGSFALGAARGGASIEKSMEIAEENDVYTGGPFTYLTQTKGHK